MQGKTFGAIFLVQPRVLDNLSLYCYIERIVEKPGREIWDEPA